MFDNVKYSFVLTKDTEALCLEDALQRWEVDDEELTHDGGQDGKTERPVTAQTHLMDHTSLRATRQRQTQLQHSCKIWYNSVKISFRTFLSIQPTN